MDGFLNLTLFVVVFYLIVLFAGLPDRRKVSSASPVDSAMNEKRVA
jgi:hypothetical protein